MLYLTRKSITKGVVHFTPNAVYTLSEILSKHYNWLKHLFFEFQIRNLFKKS
jgi:hypothetical protein